MIISDCFLNILQYIMGQSMQRPSRSTLRNANSRFSARSLQRSSNHSIQDKRISMSASKLPEIQQQGRMGNEKPSQQNQIKKGELLIATKCEDASLSIRQSNKLKVQRASIGGQTSPHSPNFREIAETGAEYGLGHWGAANTSKQSLQACHNDAHHDITISFSKTKNINNNPFNDENSERKSALNQILEYHEESQNAETAALLPFDCNQRYLASEIDRIAGTHSMYSENFNKNVSPGNTSPQEGTPKKLRTDNKKQESIQSAREASHPQRKLQSPKTMNESGTIEANQYNDYDCADFKRKVKEGEAKPRKTVKLSKKMEELKQKIASRASNSKDKEQILKGSIQRLSRSLRKNNSLQSRSREESRNKLRPVLSKVQCLDIKIQSKAEVMVEGSKKKEDKIKSSKSPKQSIIEEKKSKIEDPSPKDIYFAKIRSSQQLGKTTNSSQHSDSKQYKTYKHIPPQQATQNKKNDYVLQNLQPQQNIHGSAKKLQSLKKEPSFTEMVKKDHLSNKLKKKGQQKQAEEPLQYSQVQKGISSPVSEQAFASTCRGNKFISGQEYQFFDLRELKKPKEQESKIIKQQINSLKLITQQLTTKDRKSKIKITLQSSHSSSHDQSARNKTYQEKFSLDTLPNVTALNYTEIIGNYEEYMLREALNRQREGQQWAKQQKKRHKSSQHSSKVAGMKSRLLVF